MSIQVLIPAGGSGSRFDASVPKQFYRLNGRTVLAWSVGAFLKHPLVTGIWIVHAASLPETQKNLLESLKAIEPDRIHLIGEAGDTRAQTVKHGLRAIHASDPADNPWVLVHDAARPGLTLAALQRLMDALDHETVGAILALPVADTLKLGVDGRIQKTLARSAMWQAQTPQAFRLDTLLTALTGDLTRFSDEASAVEALGLSPALILGEPCNLKLTHPEDAVLLEKILKEIP